jgi:putative transposase
MYPTDNQKIQINKNFGCSRFIYNYCLDKCKNNGFSSAYDLIKELPNLYNDYPWLKNADSCSLRCAIFNLEDAYKNFFAKRSNYPTFKSKHTHQSYRTNCIRSNYKGTDYSNIELDLKNKKIKLPKLGLVDIKGYRNLEYINGKIINATVSKETTVKYYVSVIVDEKEIKEKQVNATSIVGIDLGIKDLVITSNGEKYANPKNIYKYEKRLKRLQRKLSRKVIGSKNYQKTKQQIARLHVKISNSRKFNIITIVNKLVKENDIIVSETLKVKNMSQNHYLAKSILDASFSKICEMLKWKTKIIGKYYYQVDTYYPSSKTCSVCGHKTEVTKDLKVRNWKCEKCGSLCDRDINASINIMFEGLKLHYQN